VDRETDGEGVPAGGDSIAQRFDSSKGPPLPLKLGTCRWCGKPTENGRKAWHRECALDYLRDKGAVQGFATERNRLEHDGTLTCEGYGAVLAHAIGAEYEDGLKTYAVDHKVPLFRGGTNDAENLQVLCVPCHKKKTRRDLRHGPEPVMLEAFF